MSITTIILFVDIVDTSVVIYITDESFEVSVSFIYYWPMQLPTDDFFLLIITMDLSSSLLLANVHTERNIELTVEVTRLPGGRAAFVSFVVITEMKQRLYKMNCLTIYCLSVHKQLDRFKLILLYI